MDNQNPPKYICFNGIRFYHESENGYYRNSAIRMRLHRYVWEYYNGPIPDGYHIHHIDGNKSNNDISNLEMLSSEEHRKFHGNHISEEQRKRHMEAIQKARPKLLEWHKSETGKASHRATYPRTLGAIKARPYICEECGSAFESKGSRVRFCSGKCKAAWQRKSGLYDIPKICPICGKEFMANKSGGNAACSYECSCKLKSLHNTKIRAVIRTDKNGVETRFDSVTEAAKATGAFTTCVVAACKGKLQTCKGYTWRYAEEAQ